MELVRGMHRWKTEGKGHCNTERGEDDKDNSEVDLRLYLPPERVLQIWFLFPRPEVTFLQKFLKLFSGIEFISRSETPER